jgi:hypothetical protein
MRRQGTLTGDLLEGLSNDLSPSYGARETLEKIPRFTLPEKMMRPEVAKVGGCFNPWGAATSHLNPGCRDFDFFYFFFLSSSLEHH